VRADIGGVQSNLLANGVLMERGLGSQSYHRHQPLVESTGEKRKVRVRRTQTAKRYRQVWLWRMTRRKDQLHQAVGGVVERRR